MRLQPLKNCTPRNKGPSEADAPRAQGHWVTVPDAGMLCVDWVEVSPRPFTVPEAQIRAPTELAPVRPSTVASPRRHPPRGREAHTPRLPPPSSRPRPVIIEAHTSINVAGEHGDGEQVLPRTWLILDSASTVADARGRLSNEAGGGAILDLREGALHLIEESRLTAPAAEANFHRASRGLSVIALRHAAHILLYCSGKPRPESLSAPVPADIQVLTSQEVATRFRRMKTLVELRASTTSRRKDEVSQMSSKSSTSQPSSELQLPAPQQRTILQKGLQALEDFIAFANHKFGNPVRAWFFLDPEGKMSIGEKQFARACVEIGFKGNTGALWRYLDSDRSGRVTILELDPQSAVLLAEFKQIIHKDFEGSLEDTFAALDANKDGRVNRREFADGMRRFGFRIAAASRLFNMMDRELCGFLLPDNFAFLGHWDPPAYMSSQPDPQGLEQLKQVLRSTYRLLLRAWRKILDKDGAMRVAWDDFREACRALWMKTATQSLPQSDMEIAAIWRALDQDCCGWISLAHFDSESYAAVREFKKWAEETHGTIHSAFRHLSGRNWKLTAEDLMKAECYGNVVTPNLELLLKGLNVHDNMHVQVKTQPNGASHRVEIPYLVESDMRFLDRWDLAFEERESRMRQPNSQT